MPVGRSVRRLFGRHERRVAEAYRRIFIDLDALVAQIGQWTQPTRILEIGCGEGAVTERLAAAFPDADITAIDISEHVGRLFVGNRSRVTFRQVTVDQVAAEAPRSFDLVLLSDVIHHVPSAQHATFFTQCLRAVAPGGNLVFKDWVATSTPIHWLCVFSDRYITGDAVTFYSDDALRAFVADNIGTARVVEDARIAPWANNLAFLIRVSS